MKVLGYFETSRNDSLAAQIHNPQEPNPYSGVFIHDLCEMNA